MANDFTSFSHTNDDDVPEMPVASGGFGEDGELSSRARDISQTPDPSHSNIDPQEDVGNAARAIGPATVGAGGNRSDAYSSSDTARAYRRAYEESAQQTVYDKPKTMAYSVASLVLSILSVVCCCTGFVSLLFGVLAIVFSIVSRRHLGYFDSMAIVGLVLGIIGSILGLFLGLVSVLGIFSGEGEILEEIFGADGNTEF